MATIMKHSPLKAPNEARITQNETDQRKQNKQNKDEP